MSEKEKHFTRINGNKYRVVARESRWSKRVTVQNGAAFGRGNTIVERKVYKGLLWWIGPDSSPPIDEVVRDTLNEAVCKREKKIDKKERFEESLKSAVEQVSEVHEE